MRPTTTPDRQTPQASPLGYCPQAASQQPRIVTTQELRLLPDPLFGAILTAAIEGLTATENECYGAAKTWSGRALSRAAAKLTMG